MNIAVKPPVAGSVIELLGLKPQKRSFMYVLAEAEASNALHEALTVFTDTEMLEGRDATEAETAAFERVEAMAENAYQRLLRLPVLDMDELHRKAKFLKRVSRGHDLQEALDAIEQNIRDLSSRDAA